MAQETREEKMEENPEDEEETKKEDDSIKASTSTSNGNNKTNTSTSTSSSSSSSSKNTSSTKSSFKFNAHAPEFVPVSSHTQMAIAGYYYPYYNYLAAAAAAGDGSGSDWIYVADQDQYQYVANATYEIPDFSRNFVNDDLQQRIIKQVEYQFSGLSLLANESLVKQINKDPEGYVPITVIASTRKIKSLNTNHQMIVQALRSSTKLVVSSDGKRVKRKQPFTDRDKEELQSRTVVAENLPDDHSHQNLEKIFNVVGSVKTIRICHPQESNSSRSKSDYVFSNKLHALVEYESPAIAENAVEKLNDGRNWRKGLRVRLLLRLSPKSVLKKGKSEFDGCLDEENGEAPMPEVSEHPNNIEHVDNNAEESSAAVSKKGWGRGRGKGGGRPRVQSHNGRGLLAPSPQLSNFNIHSEAPPPPPLKQTTKGPRMPDGTRGFTMGRGKPILPTPPILARIPSQTLIN